MRQNPGGIICLLPPLSLSTPLLWPIPPIVAPVLSMVLFTHHHLLFVDNLCKALNTVDHTNINVKHANSIEISNLINSELFH